MRTLLAFFLLLPAIHAQQNRAGKTNYPPQLSGAEQRIYKKVDGVELTLYIFKPKDHRVSDPRPAIIFFFGGGWKAGSPAQFAPHCEHYAKKGLVAITVDYRVKSRHGVKAVSCVEDAKSAIRWVRSQADQLGIDPNRIVAGGGSAGGHLAAATGTVTQFDRTSENLEISSVPNAMMLFNPACILGPIPGKETEWNKKAASINERTGVPSTEISPYHQIRKGNPPTIIFHGKADTTVPYQTAELFTMAMKKAGNRCDLVGFDDMPHGFFNRGRFQNKPFEETLEKADAFLASLGYL